MRFSRWFAAGLVTMTVMGGSLIALGAGKSTPVTPPAPITGDFTLQVSAAYVPVPATTNASAPAHAGKGTHAPPTFLTGAGTASATTNDVSVTINGLADKAGTTTATVLVSNPLTRDATWTNKFTGAGTAVVTVGGVDTPLNVTVQGQLVQGKFGTRIEGCFYTAPDAKGAPPTPQLRGEFEGFLPPPPPAPIFGTFTLKVGAVYVPVPPAPAAIGKGLAGAAAVHFPGTFLTGTGSGTADNTGVTATIDPLTDKAGTTSAVVTLDNPLAPDSKNPNKFSGTGKVAVTVGGVETDLDVNVQGHLEQGKHGPKIEGYFYTVPAVQGAPAAPKFFGEFEGPVTPAP